MNLENHGETALAITPSHQQNTHDFADGRKNMNDLFNNYVCSASHMRSGLHFQNVSREPWEMFWEPSGRMDIPSSDGRLSVWTNPQHDAILDG